MPSADGPAAADEQLPDWEPLERALPDSWLDGWMFMCTIPRDSGTALRAYKHVITRRYLYLRLEDGHVAAYRPDRDQYVPAKLIEQVEDAYAAIETLGFSRDMKMIPR